MKKIAYIIIVLLLLYSNHVLFSQNIAITDDDAYTANTSAMLDVKSLTKGLLVPRLTTAQRTAIATPATGLLVFDTTINGFYYYNGSAWINLTSGSSGGLFWSYTSPNIYMTTSTNSLGLGTSSPQHKLHIYQSVTTADGTDGVFADIQNYTNTIGTMSGIRLGTGAYGTPDVFKGGIFYRNVGTYNRGDIILANNSSAAYTNVTSDDGRLVVQNDGRVMVKGDPAQGVNAAIFAVQNNNGDTVFAVYPEGVRIWVNDDGGSKASGNRGGFAVGGFSPSKAGFTNEYLRVTPDSVRVYIDDDFVGSKATGNRGGFAVGGFDPAKGSPTSHYLFVQDDSTRVFVNDSTSGFGVENIEGGAETRIMRLTTENYLIGHLSGISLTGKYNSFYGYKTAPLATSANKNVLIGYETGLSLTTGDYNVFMGTQSGNKNAGGSENNFIGYQAGYNNSTGVRNVFIGYQAGYNNTTKTRNTMVGCQSGYSNIDGEYNSLFGHYSGFYANLGNYNIIMGYYSGYNADDASNCVILGSSSLREAQGVSNSVVIGTSSGYYADNISDNVFVGTDAGHSADGSSNTISIGTSSGYNNNAANNLFIGTEAGYTNTSGTKNVFMGYRAGYNNTTGEKNISIGNHAGYSNTSQSQTICIGDSAGSHNTAPLNIFIGPNAGVRNTSGVSNLFIGNSAGAATTTTGFNTYVGWYAGGTNTGEGNTFIGPFSGWTTVNGSRNVYLGMFAGNGNDGTDNVFIGYNTSSGGSNQLAINNGSGIPLIYGEFNTKRIGIYDESPSANLHIKQYGTNEEGLAIENDGDTDIWAWEIGGNDLNLSFNGVDMGYWNDLDGSYILYSDKRLKKDIEVVNESLLTKVLKLEVVNYHMINADENSEKSIGFIAQDVQVLFPELVRQSEDDFLSLNYNDFGIISIKAIQEQQKIIENQNKRIEDLEAKIELLNKKMESFNK
ncbi:MAG: tail fiber domain-containing protein [Bacteroidota bacterium]